MIKPYYQDELCTIFNARCEDVLPQLAPVDLICTDPPYGIFACGGKWGRKSELQWDKKPAGNINEVLRYGKDAVIWGGNYFTLPPSRGWLVWYKRDSVPSAADVELAWTTRDMNARLIDQTIAATNAERVGHPTQKPLAVIKWTLSFFPSARCVLDPFAGSGTTGRAAKDLGIKSILIEIEKKYCDIAIERLRQQAFNFAEAE